MGGTCCGGCCTARPDLPSELKDLFHQLSGVSLAREAISLSVPEGATSAEERRFAHSKQLFWGSPHSVPDYPGSVTTHPHTPPPPPRVPSDPSCQPAPKTSMGLSGAGGCTTALFLGPISTLSLSTQSNECPAHWSPSPQLPSGRSR